MAIGNERLGSSAAWTTDAPIDSVEAFYQQALSRSPWELMGSAPSGRGWRFKRTQGQSVRGEVLFVQQNSLTEIQLVLVRVSSFG